MDLINITISKAFYIADVKLKSNFKNNSIKEEENINSSKELNSIYQKKEIVYLKKTIKKKIKIKIQIKKIYLKIKKIIKYKFYQKIKKMIINNLLKILGYKQNLFIREKFNVKNIIDNMTNNKKETSFLEIKGNTDRLNDINNNNEESNTLYKEIKNKTIKIKQANKSFTRPRTVLNIFEKIILIESKI